MCDNKAKNEMGTLVNGSEVFNLNNADDSGSSNRSTNSNFGPNFRVLKRTDQVSVKKNTS
jgi:hypothetical protein